MKWPVAMRRAAVPPRRDPAPTRFAYRLQRFMLTPVLRKIVFRWGPICAVVGGAAYVAQLPQNRERALIAWQDLRGRIEGMDAFRVDGIEILGASDGLQAQLREAFPYDFPQSRFEFDFDYMRGVAMDIPAVKNASLAMAADHILRLDIAERSPVALWRKRDGLVLVDEEGVVIGDAGKRSDYPTLPVMAGAAADQAIHDLPTLRAVLGPLAARLRGFERRGARRWDVVLDRDQRIMLPENNAVGALERVAGLAQVSDLFERDMRVVDLRLPARPTVRLTNAAQEALVEARKTAAQTVKEQ